MNDSENICALFEILNNTQISIELNEIFKDGRLNSSFNEEAALDYIKQVIERNGYIFEKANIRSWYDFKFNGTPFNLKISNMLGADNVFSSKGLVYAFTGKVPSSNKHQDYLNLLESNFINTNEYDYGFLIIDKRTKKIYITSIKNIDVNYLVANGSNLPFQIKWNFLDNKLKHSSDKQLHDILLVFYNSWLKKINIDLHPLERLINKL